MSSIEDPDADAAGPARRRALVCGASGGLGGAVAAALLADGVDVLGTGRRDDAVAPAAGPGRWHYVAADLADVATPGELLATAGEQFGGVDVVVVNSGGPPPGAAADLTADALEAQVRPMLSSAIDLIHRCLPPMIERGWGRIIAIGSSGVREPLPNLVISNVLRAGLAAYLKTLAAEVAEARVTVNMVLPGRIATDRVAALDQARAERMGVDVGEVAAASRATIPAGRYGRAAEFAAAVAFLASPAASYITGEQLRVDGGMARGA